MTVVQKYQMTCVHISIHLHTSMDSAKNNRTSTCRIEAARRPISNPRVKPPPPLPQPRAAMPIPPNPPARNTPRLLAVAAAAVVSVPALVPVLLLLLLSRGRILRPGRHSTCRGVVAVVHTDGSSSREYMSATSASGTGERCGGVVVVWFAECRGGRGQRRTRFGEQPQTISADPGKRNTELFRRSRRLNLLRNRLTCAQQSTRYDHTDLRAERRARHQLQKLSFWSRLAAFLALHSEHTCS